MTTCRGCGREIIWGKTSHGKNIPLDPKALVFSVIPEGNQLIAVKPTTGIAGERFMVSHWATCPKVEDLRKKSETKSEKNFSEPKSSREG